MSSPRISFILPAFLKFDLFRSAWPLNEVYRHPESEVVIILDEPSEERFFVDFAKLERHAKIRVLVNDDAHDWRPPAIPINVGVRHAEGQFIAILSPETVIDTPTPHYLSHRVRTGTMLLGLLWHVSGWNREMNQFDLWHRIHHIEITNSPGMGYGFLCVEKTAFEAIRGMLESQHHYGRDDDSIRIRLVRYGMMGVVDPMLKLFHIWHEGTERNTPPADVIPPSVVYSHQANWGRRQSFRVAFDWRNA